MTLLLMTLATFAGEEVRPIDPTFIEKSFRPFVKSYCLDCHAGDDAEAKINLDVQPNPSDFARNREFWLKVLGQVRAQGMPPEDNPMPSPEERQSIVEFLLQSANQVDCANESRAGRVTIRRLNRVEYDNTIRDLLGLDFHPADDFPADDVGNGFDNQGDVLSLTPLLMEKYFTAAERIAERAIVVPTEKDRLNVRLEAETMRSTAQGRMLEGGLQLLTSNGELYKTVRIPRSGEYEFRIRMAGQQAGKEKVRANLSVDKNERQAFRVEAEVNDPVVYNASNHLSAGKHRISVAFLNDHFKDSDDPSKVEDRNLVVDYVEIEGPILSDHEANPEAHRRVLSQPIRKESLEADLRASLQTFVGRAYRRPAKEAEIDRLAHIAMNARGEDDPIEVGVQSALQAILTSPHFLFKMESDPGETNKPARPLNDFEIATRLSYFLWSSMPDDELFDLARAGKLKEESVLRAQVHRLIADPKFESFVTNFAGQWLQLRNLDVRTPDKDAFPSFSNDLRQAMRRETELVFANAIRENQSTVELLTGESTFVNELLAKHYGIEGVTGLDYRAVSLVSLPRVGVLTHASILTITSDPARTSPVKRGKWVLETLLGEPPPTPPANVPPLEETAEATGSLRQRLEAHRANPSCAVCHQEMDPIGFGLENFDAIGAWREKEGPHPIDATGVLPDGAEFRGPKELIAVLSRRKEAFVRSFVKNLLVYALGRGLEYYDECVIDDIVEAGRQDDYRLQTLMESVARSRPFLYQDVKE